MQIYLFIRRFETEQRKQFHGVSEQELKMAHAPSYKKLPEVYKPPTEPLETLTSQKVIRSHL